MTPPKRPPTVMRPSLVRRFTSDEMPSAPMIAAKAFTPRKNSTLVVSMPARLRRICSERAVFAG